jgi:hypothetical protein
MYAFQPSRAGQKVLENCQSCQPWSQEYLPVFFLIFCSCEDQSRRLANIGAVAEWSQDGPLYCGAYSSPAAIR